MTVSVSYAVTTLGDSYLDGIFADRKWVVPGGDSLKFSFPTSTAVYGSYSDGAGELSSFVECTADQKTLSRFIMALFTSITGVPTLEVAAGAAAEIRIAQYGGSYHAYYPEIGAGGDVWLAMGYGTAPMTYGWTSHFHEHGHAFGLKHGHTSSLPDFPAVPSDRDGYEYTIMTYRGYIGANTSGYDPEPYGAPLGWSSLDLAALRAIYGSGTDTTVQSIHVNPSTGEVTINGSSYFGATGNGKVLFTPVTVDGAIDLDLSDYSTNQTIRTKADSWTLLKTAQLSDLGNDATNYASGNLYTEWNRTRWRNIEGGIGTNTWVPNSLTQSFTGNGSDTLILVGERADYSVTEDSPNVFVVTDNGSNGDGITTITNFDFITFADQANVSLSEFGGAATMSAGTGAFALYGQLVLLRATNRILADIGSLSLTGQNAALKYTPNTYGMLRLTVTAS